MGCATYLQRGYVRWPVYCSMANAVIEKCGARPPMMVAPWSDTSEKIDESDAEPVLLPCMHHQQTRYPVAAVKPLSRQSARRKLGLRTCLIKHMWSRPPKHWRLAVRKGRTVRTGRERWIRTARQKPKPGSVDQAQYAHAGARRCVVLRPESQYTVPSTEARVRIALVWASCFVPPIRWPLPRLDDGRYRTCCR